ncbi:glycyl radical enzyme domain-containing protein [Shigella flexneri]
MWNRTLPDAFTHVDVGHAIARITGAILRAEPRFKQVAPNLTFIYNPEITPDDLLLQVAQVFLRVQ